MANLEYNVAIDRKSLSLTNKKNKNTMKIYSETTLRNFQAWSGAIETKQAILDADKEDEFEQLIDELYPEGIDETKLNDILWFDSEWVLESLGITETEIED